MTAELQKGLEDVVVAQTRLSRIDGEGGELEIGGYPLEVLAPNATYEETLYLLYEDRLPDADELAAFRRELRELRSIPEATRELLRAGARSGRDPMDALRMGVASASPDVEADPEREAMAAVARIPTVVATYWRLSEGNEPVDPDPELGHAANYLWMLTGEKPSPAAVRGLETYLNSVVDHGLNASTFTARAIVSTESDVFSAVTGAVGALKGPLHGGAPGPVLDMLEEIADDDRDPAEYVRDVLEAGERLMGFGHRVYDVRDPRAAVLGEAAQQFYRGSDREAFFALAEDVEDVAVDVLAEHRPDLALETNVEFYTAVLLNGVGIDRDLFTPTFAVGRAGGWTAHCLEQLGDNRLIRPRAEYAGASGRRWTPVEDR